MQKTDADLRHEYDQVLEFWRWLKVQPLPDTGQDGDDPIWREITESAKAIDSNSKPLLRALLFAGIDYINEEWRRRVMDG